MRVVIHLICRCKCSNLGRGFNVLHFSPGKVRAPFGIGSDIAPTFCDGFIKKVDGQELEEGSFQVTAFQRQSMYT